MSPQVSTRRVTPTCRGCSTTSIPPGIRGCQLPDHTHSVQFCAMQSMMMGSCDARRTDVQDWKKVRCGMLPHATPSTKSISAAPSGCRTR
eukprot:2232740-Rhodomonas_salina.2